MTLPKVLFLDIALHRKDATGITLSNLFGKWPKEKFFMMGNSSQTKMSLDAGYNNVYTLTDIEYQHIFPINIFKSIIKANGNSDQLSANSSIIISQENRAKRTVKIGLLTQVKKKLMFLFTFLGLDLAFLRCKLSENLIKWIESSNPDCFYALLSTRNSILFAIEVSKKFNKPLYIHIMDDWPATIGTNTLFSNLWNKRINNEFRTLLNSSYCRIAISEAMASQYKTRFGGEWTFFHNPIDFNFWNKSVKKSYDNNESFTLLYSGRLTQGIDNTIQKIALCIDELIESESFNIKLKIQSNTRPEWVKNYKSILFSSYIEYDLLPELYSSVDLLLLPYDFRGSGFDFIRLSMPTKAAEYMASGTPILLIAPKSTALSQYSKKYNWGYVINSDEKADIKKGIMELYLNKALRCQIGEKGIEIARNRHSIDKVQDAFQSLFDSLKIS